MTQSGNKDFNVSSTSLSPYDAEDDDKEAEEVESCGPDWEDEVEEGWWMGSLSRDNRPVLRQAVREDDECASWDSRCRSVLSVNDWNVSGEDIVFGNVVAVDMADV